MSLPGASGLGNLTRVEERVPHSTSGRSEGGAFISGRHLHLRDRDLLKIGVLFQAIQAGRDKSISDFDNSPGSLEVRQGQPVQSAPNYVIKLSSICNKSEAIFHKKSRT